MRWLSRGIGLINIVIVARILSPEDFGLVAMASVVLGLLSVFSDFGVEIQVLRSKRTDADFLNTAWTIQVLRGIFLGVCLLAITPLVTSYFGRLELSALMLVYAVSAALSSFTNIGVVLFRKELNFAADFRYEVSSKVVSVLATIGLAVWLQNYWALVFGHMVGSVGRVILSFIMHQYRPKFCFRDVRQFLRFTVFSTAIGTSIFLQRRLDFFVVGKIGTASQVGIYNMAFELSSMFTSEIVAPVARSLTANYAHASNDLEEVRAVYLNVLSVMALILWPVGFGLAAVGHEAVLIILGAKWTMAAPFIAWLAIGESVRAIITQLRGNILVILHKEHVTLQCVSIQLIITAAIVIIGGIYWGQIGVAQGVVIASSVTLPVTIYIVGRNLEISGTAIYARLWRPFLAAVAMYSVLSTMPAQTEAIYLWLPAKMIAGAVIYAVALAILAFLFNNPQSVEKELLNRLLGAIRDRVNSRG